MANKKRNLSKSFKKVKKINVFVLLTQVLCMKLAVSWVVRIMRPLKKERREKIKLKDTNLSLQALNPVSVKEKIICLRHKCFITLEAGVLVGENNSRIEQAYPPAGVTFP